MSLFENYIQKRNPMKNDKMFKITNNVSLVITSKLSSNVDLEYVLNFLRTKIHQKFWNCVDGVYVAELPDFKRRNINAIFKDDVVYVTGKQDSSEDFLDDIVHELGHGIEEKYRDLIYGDGHLENDFLQKRVKVYNKYFKKSGLDNKKLYNLFIHPEYSKELDDFFYRDIGYDKLRNMTNDLFMTPYGITSLREYWANTFENFVLGQKERAKEICPKVCQKIVYLLGDKSEEYMSDDYIDNRGYMDYIHEKQGWRYDF